MKNALRSILLLLALSGAAQAQPDLHTSIIPGPYLRPGTYVFTLGVENAGNQGAAFRLFWQVDNGPVQSHLQGYPATLGAHAQPTEVAGDSLGFTVTVASRQLKVWVSTLNGVTDLNNANDTIVQPLKVMADLPDKHVLLEMYKHQTCGPCYNAVEYNKQHVEPLSNYSIASLYMMPADVLYNAGADGLNLAMNIYEHPAALFDRYWFPHLGQIYPYYNGSGTDYRLQELGRRDDMYEPVGVRIDYTV